MAVWDIFNSVREFIEFIPFDKDITGYVVRQITRIIIDPISENESFIILCIEPYYIDYQIIWNKLDLSEHLERSGLDQNWIKLDPSEHIITDLAPYAYGIDENNKFDKVQLTDLDEKTIKYYLGIEPWTLHPAEKILDNYVKQRFQFPRYVIYLDKEKQIRLLIGYSTIQVWHEKRLEFIYVVNNDPETPEEHFEVVEIRYGKNKFDLVIEFEEGKEIKKKKEIRIKIEHEDDIIQIVRNTIKTLVYLNNQSKSINLVFGGKRIKFNKTVRQTKNIITRFTTLYPNSWRLIDFRYKLMLEFIKLKDYPLIIHLLFNEKNAWKNIISKYSKNHKNNEKERPLHSWLVPLKGMLPDEEMYTDLTMLTFFLEYYSNNAMDNIGWMNVVSEIIPVLYKRNYGWYIQQLFFKPCFGRKSLDLSGLKFYEIKNHPNSLKVFIPIAQLVPCDNDLNLKEFSDFENHYIRMVPLIDFATNNEALNTTKENKFMQTITRLFLPRKYSSVRIEEHSHFVQLLRLIEDGDAFYDNPSMEAIMNWIWLCSKIIGIRLDLTFGIFGL
ncbi:transient receptor potential cation channel subfamily a member 1-like isoform x1 [Gigaspora margarita]|uniref:Transient receptor potential cation channel subfamily a member 1-like isoform x1 n=1 Tax=Gigaspora margarita TaxID=4874 RepID=A0A8H4B0Q9_GIGMA|nr:transient receptor potential cation channel subfamily a member 1-like isoform x1 [Gigaspora margarita]